MDKEAVPIPSMFQQEFQRFKKVEQIVSADIEHLIADFQTLSQLANNLLAKTIKEIQNPQIGEKKDAE